MKSQGTTAAMNLLQRAAQRQDIVLVCFLVLTVFMIVLPLPTTLVDTLIAVNIAVTILVLMVAVYLRDPVEFSTLPAMILFSTLFRLALSITTTRLILIQADAGRIVETFGLFVIAGNLVVGLVVFLIITIVQFLVITKGAERVAEVSARFSLDALPGKQMSIDSDMRSGEIDLPEARRRRMSLQRESEFYGAMDGAMKFVKGDAIACLVIIAVNLLGGIGVGMLQRDMSLGEALSIYALLTVGDGLVAQIPALLMSISAGSVITRVATEDGGNLGSDIAAQLFTEPGTLRLAALVLCIFAFVPGFPTFVFLLLAAGFAGVSLFLGLRRRRESSALEDRLTAGGSPTMRSSEDEVMLAPSASVVLTLGEPLARSLDAKRFAAAQRRLREQLYERCGVAFPTVRAVPDGSDEPRYRLLVENIPVAEGLLPTQGLWLRDDRMHAELLGIEVADGPAIGDDRESLWVDSRHRQQLERAGIAYLGLEEALAQAIATELPRHVAQFIGIQETRALLAGMEARYGDLVKEAQRHVPLQKIAEILRRLVEEGVSVRNLRVILEALVEWGQREKDVVLLTEYVRTALKRQISHQHASSDRIVCAYVLEPDTEQVLRDAVRHTSVGSYLALSPDASDRLLDRVRNAVGDLSRHRDMPVILTAMDIRRFLRSFLVGNGIRLPVLSHQEIASEFAVQPLSTIAIA